MAWCIGWWRGLKSWSPALAGQIRPLQSLACCFNRMIPNAAQFGIDPIGISYSCLFALELVLSLIGSRKERFLSQHPLELLKVYAREDIISP